MEGRLVEICNNESFDIIDTGNNKYGKMRMYYRGRIKEALSIGSTVKFKVKKSSSGNYYALFISAVERNDVVKNQISINTEDRPKWYDWGEHAEWDFIHHVVPHIADDIRQHPCKKNVSWAIDLYNYTKKRPADLKTQNTPFFKVGTYCYKGVSCNPAYSVTFNKKDYENYLANYPNCIVYYWIHWTQLSYKGISIPEIYGVWAGDFPKMVECIKNCDAPLHTYLHRQNDDHNAKESYIFDLRDKDVFEEIEIRI